MENIRKKAENLDFKNIIKICFIITAILFIVPSLLYIIENKTILNYESNFTIFIENKYDRKLSAIYYLILFALMTIIYLVFVKKKEMFKNIKQILYITGIVSAIFLFMLPFTSSDIFYYMGVGELNSVYKQNPYYVSVKQYYENKYDKTSNDTILEKGSENIWANTTVVYGPIAEMIFSICTKLAFKNIDVCILIFKIVNLIIHILNCYLIYKLSSKLKYAIIYGLNPFMFLEFIGNVHNDIIVVFFTLLAFYFLLKRKNLVASIVFLAIATGIKYFTILLLPIIVLYYFKDEKKLSTRILKCVEYGLLFLAIMLLEYVFYYKDSSIFTAMLVQNSKYSCSIYTGITVLLLKLKLFARGTLILKSIQNTIFLCFVVAYLKFVIDLLTEKKFDFNKILQKYNWILLIFMFSLTTFHQWYWIWLFATFIWQKPKTIGNIVNISLASEFANSIYMFYVESWHYDLSMIIIMIISFVILSFISKKGRIFENEKIIIN